MRAIYQPTASDRRFYETTLRDFLPERMVDVHSHLVHPDHLRPPTPERLARYWMLRVPLTQTYAEFRENFARLLPGKQIVSIAFGFPILESDLERQNAFVLECAQNDERIKPFFVTRPEDTEAALEAALARGFLGFKPYPDFARASQPGEERIGQFLTPAMCRAADRHGALVMLHISKSGRLADPDNLHDLVELTETYPRIKLIVAHYGRAYNPYYLERALELLGGPGPWYYDFSAVTNPAVHKLALQSIPHKHILFGLDTPIMFVRGHYEFPSARTYKAHIHGGHEDCSHELPLAYEILKGFKQAADEVSLGRESIENIFFRNAIEMLAGQSQTMPIPAR